ncbi:MAG TPA: hypothetical protein VN617_12625 [Rhodoferax sp.]|nr:hypothetical protein [Rhodoferax sp.]
MRDPSFRRTIAEQTAPHLQVQALDFMHKRLAQTVTLAVALMGCCPVAQARAKGFAGLQCGANIPKLLIGRTMPNERVVVTERRYRNLGLKDLGATELDAGSNAIWWSICGAELVELEDSHSVVRDVLSFDSVPSKALLFEGGCTVNHQLLRNEVIAVLTDQAGHAMLAATKAWTIDAAKGRFMPQGTTALLCPRSGAHAVESQ